MVKSTLATLLVVVSAAGNKPVRFDPYNHKYAVSALAGDAAVIGTNYLRSKKQAKASTNYK